VRLALPLFLAIFLLPALACANQIDDAQAAIDHHDYQTAQKILPPLAERGYVDAQMQLGEMYEQALGVTQDYAKAAKWYRMAADQGNVEAQYHIGYDYENSQGVLQDYAEAVKWFLKAADQGNDMAQQALGRLYKAGKGVKQDWAESYFWFSLAVKGGQAVHSVIRSRDGAATYLNAQQKAVVDKRVAEWTPVSVAPVVPPSHGEFGAPETESTGTLRPQWPN